MTFWYVFWNGLNFFKLFKLLFSLGIDHDPHILYVHMTYVYSFLMFYSSHDVMAKRSQHHIMVFYFGVLIDGRIPTLISFYLLHKPTTPILPIYVDQ